MDRQIAEKILMYAKRLNADGAEVFIRAFTATSVEVKDQKVDAFERSRDIGAGLRVVANGRQGFAFTTDLSDDTLNVLAQSAIANAENAQPDPYVSIPQKAPAAYEPVRIYDPDIVRLS